MKSVSIRVPATSANLGPGFDCLGLALDLWNETVILWQEPPGRYPFTATIYVEGEGSGFLPGDDRNWIVRAALYLMKKAGAAPPGKVEIRCKNGILLSSGLGSSAAAVLTGLMAANAWLEKPLGQAAILKLATELEGHPDNVAAAIFGGLALVAPGSPGEPPLVQTVPIPVWSVVVALPGINLSTQAARASLPEMVPLKTAVANIGRSMLVVEALRNGDETLLGKAMQDRLHQPYRLPRIPGAEEAILAARQAGAAAAALSGAGPGVIAFLPPNEPSIAEHVLKAMEASFHDAGVQARGFQLRTTSQGASIEQK